MIKEAIGVGDTIELAQLNAKQALGIADDDYDVEIEFELLQKPEKKILGLFGGSQAKVLAKVALTITEIAQNYIEDIIKNMGISNVEVTSTLEDNMIMIDLKGDDVGYLIGRRGDTLDSLQYLTSLVVNMQSDDYYRVSVNTGDYREKREKTLEILGRKMAFKAIKSRRKCSLEPMNPYERRIIHTSVQKVDGAISWSEGENLNRHVVIGPDPAYRKNNRYNKYDSKKTYNKSRGYNRGYNKNYNTSDEAPAEKRAPIDESGSFGLYGRIDK